MNVDSPRKSDNFECYASDILSRPTSGVLLILASGRNFGVTYGTDASEFEIGFDKSCLLSLDDAPDGDQTKKVSVSRSNTGWNLRSVQGGPVLVNCDWAKRSHPLRSGDIIRFSVDGPDVQFVLQSGGINLGALAANCIAKRRPVRDARTVSLKIESSLDANGLVTQVDSGESNQAAAEEKRIANAFDII